ncbi:hypothetical protein DLE60_29225 [Micromonospora globispora]|uniref:Uncharacterized protein n=1 Tax=Micromonospora globispora TaxID=1450148 RepID=A0A317K4J1_9ACTN|nr:hypothetical protein [Micromonospora globispora]PWU47811.1 hypothetical protein DLJ46_13490 [Micromonospora globispora]PWU54883.1 hypothetical protein DLE60_29225 [Micromonospora globispora]RQW86882.1 hypothetical protein DKL51_26750 [Micromonospora globispora]
MGLDKEIAAQLAEARLAEWRRTGYDEWREMLDNKECRLVVGEDGKRYTVVSYAIDDGEGRIRLSVAVDDGGLSALVPLVRDELMSPDGTFVT